VTDVEHVSRVEEILNGHQSSPTRRFLQLTVTNVLLGVALSLSVLVGAYAFYTNYHHTQQIASLAVDREKERVARSMEVNEYFEFSCRLSSQRDAIYIGILQRAQTAALNRRDAVTAAALEQDVQAILQINEDCAREIPDPLRPVR
jgi:hypothetical protein